MLEIKLRQNTFDEIKKYLGNNMAKDVEDNIYILSQQYAEDNNTPFLLEEIYITKKDNILKILKIYTKNIIDKIGNNELNAKSIANLTEDYFTKTTDKNIDDLDIYTDAFKCPKCGKSKSTVMRKQVLAADEPETAFITCAECGYKYTQ